MPASVALDNLLLESNRSPKPEYGRFLARAEPRRVVPLWRLAAPFISSSFRGVVANERYRTSQPPNVERVERPRPTLLESLSALDVVVAASRASELRSGGIRVGKVAGFAVGWHLHNLRDTNTSPATDLTRPMRRRRSSRRRPTTRRIRRRGRKGAMVDPGIELESADDGGEQR
jgi:hypothetical protein